jgi:hypothetical protein
MPRGKPRVTQSGDPAQKIASVPGQRYGEGVEQQAMQQAMPAPDLMKATAPSAPAVIPSPPVDPAMVQNYLGSHNPGMLGTTAHPDQPLTAGMSTGPGPGQSAIAGPRTPASRWLMRMAEDTGNPKWRRLAEQAGL